MTIQIPALAPNRLALVVDGESCLDRLYSGYYSGKVALWNVEPVM